MITARDTSWEAHYFCMACDGNLSKASIMHSNGVCPLCGNTQKGTVVDHYTKAARFVPQPKPWWNFWSKEGGHWEYSG
jgi:hypothetical protein